MNVPAGFAGASRPLVHAVLAAFIAVAAVPATASAADKPVKWSIYLGEDGSFVISLPEGYTADPNYQYDQLGPGKQIAGTSFTIPKRIWQGSNLSGDTYLSVETLAGAGPCTAARFLDGGEPAKPLTDDGIAYSVSTLSDAGAGNSYEQTVYAVRKSSPCTAVRTVIHSTNIGNYDPGTVTEFNRDALVSQFDKIRRSLKLK